VKPSERIAQLIAEAAASVQEQVNRTGGFELNFGDILRPVVRYLDEQVEIEQRRVHVRNALSMVGLGCSLTHLREQLDKAGLQVFVDVGDTWHEAQARIVGEAKREGLL
jgi:hypothetical protein